MRRERMNVPARTIDEKRRESGRVSWKVRPRARRGAAQNEGGRCVADAAGRLCMHRRAL